MIGGVGLSMALFGTVLTYYSAHRLAGTDSLSGSQLVRAGRSRPRNSTKPSMRLAFILILLGFGTKAGLAPMHTWKPDAYSEAPVPCRAAGHGGVELRALRPGPLLHSDHALPGPRVPSRLLMLFGLLSIGVAVPFILVQRNSRRLLAYPASTMAASWSRPGLRRSLGQPGHAAAHDLSHRDQAAAVSLRGQRAAALRTDLFSKIKGSVIQALPLTGAVCLATLAVTGTPPFSLFQSEFMVLRAGFAAGTSYRRSVRSVRDRHFRGALFSRSMVLGPPGEAAVRRAKCPGATVRCSRWPRCWSSLGSGCPAPLLVLIRRRGARW